MNKNLQELEHLGIKSSLAAVLSGEDVCIPIDLPTMNKEEFIDALKKKESCATLLSFFNKTAVDLDESDGFGDMIMEIKKKMKGNSSAFWNEEKKNVEDVYDMFSDTDRSGNKFVLDLENEFDTIQRSHDSGEEFYENKTSIERSDKNIKRNITQSSPKHTILSYHDRRGSLDKDYDKYENNVEDYLRDIFTDTDHQEASEIDNAINGFVKSGTLSRKDIKHKVQDSRPSKKDRTLFHGTVFDNHDFDKDKRIKRFKIFRSFLLSPIHKRLRVQLRPILKRIKK